MKIVFLIKEFNSIIEKFNSINVTLLRAWKGEGADAHRTETNHILENIGGIKDILDNINNGAVKDIKDIHTQLDNDSVEFNKIF